MQLQVERLQSIEREALEQILNRTIPESTNPERRWSKEGDNPNGRSQNKHKSERSTWTFDQNTPRSCVHWKHDVSLYECSIYWVFKMDPLPENFVESKGKIK